MIKCHRCLHPWPLLTWPGHFSGQKTWPVHNKLKSWKVAKWRMKVERWMVKAVRWRMKVERWRIKVEGGYEDGQTNGWTDICDFRVAFATEKIDLASNGLQEYFVSQQKSPLVLAPLTSRDVTRAFFWPKYLRFIKTLSQNLIWPLMAPRIIWISMKKSIGARTLDL